jgi:hypothetical protein
MKSAGYYIIVHLNGLLNFVFINLFGSSIYINLSFFFIFYDVFNISGYLMSNCGIGEWFVGNNMEESDFGLIETLFQHLFGVAEKATKPLISISSVQGEIRNKHSHNTS